MRVAGLALCLAAMLPGAALAQKAATDNEYKQRYCRGWEFAADGTGQAVLTDIGGGRTQADLFFLYRADPAKARFPASGDPVVAIYPQDEVITPSIGIWYRFSLSAAGAPDSDVLPVELVVIGGDFLDEPEGDRGLYKLRIEYGANVKLPFYTSRSLFEAMNDMTGTMASVSTPPQPANVTVAQSDLNKLVAALDSGPRVLVIERAGTDIAYLPITNREVSAERDKMFAWIRSTLPLLARGQCPAD